MPKMIMVKRANGRDSLTEDGQEWPVDGTLVENSLYVRRRLADGDLVIVADNALTPKIEPEKPDLNTSADKATKTNKGDK